MLDVERRKADKRETAHYRLGFPLTTRESERPQYEKG